MPDPYHQYDPHFRRRSSRPAVTQGYYDQDHPDDPHNDDRKPRNANSAVLSTSYVQSPGHILQSAGSHYTYSPGVPGFSTTEPSSLGHGQPYGSSHGPDYGLPLNQGNVPGPESYSGYPTQNTMYSVSTTQQYDTQLSSSRSPNHSESRIYGEHPSDLSTLDPRYVLQQRSYYTPGKIFAILWHENYGMSNGSGTVISRGPTYTGRFNERIYSAIRRMVVFRTDDNSSLCFPIKTYGNRGVAKPNVDPATHAIVYVRGTRPSPDPREPPMIKEPLEVAPDSRDETLHPMSRLDFSRVHTVEHNVKVLPIGRITSRSMQRFLQYTREEMSNRIQ